MPFIDDYEASPISKVLILISGSHAAQPAGSQMQQIGFRNSLSRLTSTFMDRRLLSELDYPLASHVATSRRAVSCELVPINEMTSGVETEPSNTKLL